MMAIEISNNYNSYAKNYTNIVDSKKRQLKAARQRQLRKQAVPLKRQWQMNCLVYLKNIAILPLLLQIISRV